jgi:Na+-translocating ferredoxin:NAD+ oxidoreductase RnfC subunit
LKQHVGAPAEPAVKVNDTVNIGDVIARPPQDALGALIHAPIDGRVVEIGQSMTIAAT